jgi:hypothetical protein
MFKRKISKKAQKAAEKYLNSLGSSREQLTDKQWNAVVNYVKRQRPRIPIFIFLILSLIMAGLSFWAFQSGSKLISIATPSETIEVIFVSEAGEESVEASDFSCYIRSVAKSYWHCGNAYALTLLNLFALFIFCFYRHTQRKTLEAFIPRKAAEQISSPEE